METGNGKQRVTLPGETYQDAALRMLDNAHPDTWRVKMGRVIIPDSQQLSIRHWIHCQYLACCKARDRLANSRISMRKDDWETFNAKKYKYWDHLASYFRKCLADGIGTLDQGNHKEALTTHFILPDQPHEHHG